MDDNILMQKQLESYTCGRLSHINQITNTNITRATNNHDNKYIFEILFEDEEQCRGGNKSDLEILEQSDLEVEALNIKDGHYYDDDNVDSKF